MKCTLRLSRYMPSNSVGTIHLGALWLAKFSWGRESYFKTFDFREILLCALRDFEKQSRSISLFSSLN